MATSAKTSSIFTSFKNQKQPKKSLFHENNNINNLSFLNNSSSKKFLKLSYTKSKHNNLVTKNALNTNTLDATSPVSAKPKEPSVLNNGTKRTRPMILVSEKLGEAGLAVLREYGEVDCIYDLTPEDLCKNISKYDALIVRSGTKVNRAVFEAAKGGLKVVGRAGVGIDNVDLQAATEHGSLVVNAPTANTIAAAEHGIALLTSMARNVAQADASMKADEALRMVDQAKTPAKSAALLRKEAALAKKAAVEAKDSEKGGESVKKIPRSFSKLLKRQGDDLEKTPAAKAARKDPPPPQKQTSAQSSRPTTRSKSPAVLKKLSESSERSQQKAPDVSTASKGGEPPKVAGGAATTGEEQKPETHPEAQDLTSHEQDLASFAKQMVRTLTRSEKNSIPDLKVVDFDRIMGPLAEVMLRVDSLRGPFRRKQEEVNDAKRRALENLNSAEYSDYMCNLKIKAVELKQEDLIRSLTTANDEANSRAGDLDKQLQDAKSDLKALEDADKENAQLRADVTRLGIELVNLRNKQSDELAQEQKRLTEENERDNLARLKITWSLLYPEIDFEVYKLRYDYATEVYDAQQLGDAPPPRFKDWAAEHGYEVSDTEEPADEHNEGQASQTQPEQPPQP